MKTMKTRVSPSPMAARPKSLGPIKRAMTMTDKSPISTVPMVSRPDQRSERSGEVILAKIYLAERGGLAHLRGWAPASAASPLWCRLAACKPPLGRASIVAVLGVAA